ncbi:hypothetical protein ACFWJ5_03550 [Streptomyces qaidamensis]|uniref:Uncharacterized protein n=1 Tax=Streptomyces cahuitamycinicus TaxID=2070367 RepID=A0A2N8TXD8_9ACTN|nr:hypothetical protein [Streptomyces cahuitamycinicus]PNG23640.1 hypothetical protein C1J00_02760 [Streptomyces cahuitamycinicus]
MEPEQQGNGHRHLANIEDIAPLLLGGDAGRQKHLEAVEAGPLRIPPAELQEAVELHVCMGLNACKGHGVRKTGEMAGMGECATVFHVCHGANECRRQGGCGYSGSDAEQAKPGDQNCRWNGSCASPINESRVHAAGPYRGTSVWKRARKIFEQRMFEAGIPFGPAPGEGYPDALVPSYETPAGPMSPSDS